MTFLGAIGHALPFLIKRYKEIRDSARYCEYSGSDRACSHRLHQKQIHGHPVFICYFSGNSGGIDCAWSRYIDRETLVRGSLVPEFFKNETYHFVTPDISLYMHVVKVI